MHLLIVQNLQLLRCTNCLKQYYEVCLVYCLTGMSLFNTLRGNNYVIVYRLVLVVNWLYWRYQNWMKIWERILLASISYLCNQASLSTIATRGPNQVLPATFNSSQVVSTNFSQGTYSSQAYHSSLICHPIGRFPAFRSLSDLSDSPVGLLSSQLVNFPSLW